MLLSYYYLALVGEGYYKHIMTNVAAWLGCYVCIFAILSYLTTVKQYLTIFFSKNYVSLERSPLDEAKKSIEPLKK